MRQLNKKEDTYQFCQGNTGYVYVELKDKIQGFEESQTDVLG